MALDFQQRSDGLDEAHAGKRQRTLNFDDVYVGNFGGAGFVPEHYSGLTWSNTWAVMDPSEYVSDFPKSGYFTGTTSGKQVAWNNNGDPLEITAKAFNLISLNLTSAWDKKMTVEIVAHRKGQIVYDETFTVGDKGPLHIDLGLKRINDITFTATEVKVDRKFEGAGPYMVIDDIVVSRVKSLPAAAFITNHQSTADDTALHWEAVMRKCITSIRRTLRRSSDRMNPVVA